MTNQSDILANQNAIRPNQILCHSGYLTADQLVYLKPLLASSHSHISVKKYSKQWLHSVTAVALNRHFQNDTDK